MAVFAAAAAMHYDELSDCDEDEGCAGIPMLDFDSNGVVGKMTVQPSTNKRQRGALEENISCFDA
eukprot:14534161-Ditylum_brightwellii.AAC.1